MRFGGRRLRTVIGLLLLLPAAVALVISYGAPTFWTVRTGWGHDIEAEGFGFALSLAVLPLLTILVIAPLLAYAAYRSGRPGRWLLRLGLALPTVCFAPTAFATAWLLGRGRYAADSAEVAAGTAAQADEPHWLIRLAIWTTLLGVICGVGVTLYLAAFRAREPGRAMRPAVLTVGGLAAVTVVAVSLQAYAYPMLLAGGHPLTPMVTQQRNAFLATRIAAATAQASLLLAVLAVLGLLATAVVVLTGLRVEVDPVSRWLEEPAGWRSATAAVAGGLGTLAVLLVGGYGLWPWLTRLSRGGPPAGVSTFTVLSNTWLPSLVSAVVGVGVALLAGFGIGALRPLGRWSEALLLPFAPWLFVGLGPLSLAGFDRVHAAGQVNTFVGLIPPTWLAIPALVIFTVFFRGLAADCLLTGQGLSVDRGVLPVVTPMVLLVFGATVLLNAQDLSWSYVVSNDAEHLTGPLLAVRQLAELPGSHVSVGLALPPALVLILGTGLGAIQLFYLDRVTLRVGSSR